MARYEEEVFQLENFELPINADEEMVEEVEKENIKVPIIGDKERIDKLVDEELLNNNSAREREIYYILSLVKTTIITVDDKGRLEMENNFHYFYWLSFSIILPL